MPISAVLFAAASLLSTDRISVRITPEVRSTYVSLGKVFEDRPMQVTNIRLGYDLGDFGRIGVRNWDVSSLSPRRKEVHRRTLYHYEFGPTWEYDWRIVEGLCLRNDLTASWTIYDGFYDSTANKAYWWWQLDQSLENDIVVPYWRVRRNVVGTDFLYFRLGLRRRFAVWNGLYITPGVALDGGDARNQNRVFGRDAEGHSLGEGFYSITPRLEFGWTVNANFTLFAWVEQYEVMGSEARDINSKSTYTCAHNDWTLGGVGARLNF